MKITDTKHPKKAEQNFPFVGIGASAGGLDAIKKLLTAIHPDSGMAYIILQHLSPNHSGSLSDILEQYAKIPVHEIINVINLVPNHIYIIPENNNLIAQDGILKLHQRIRGERKNASIDIFFESVAEVYQSFTIGVILSGTAFEGTFGFKKIKEVGGTTIVQNPETAEFKGMPQSALDADIVDYVLAPELIPPQLLEIQKSYTTNHAYTNEEHLPKNEEEILMQIINLIFLRTGNDFRHYKQPTIRRRIARRMVMNRKESLQDYYFHLRNDKVEQNLLFNDFLIPITYFFRDQNFFNALPKLAFPQLIKNSVNNNLRIWVAGCATGEEAYSLAIELHEYLSERNNDLKVQIFASDISEKCISKARAAIYSAQDVQQISQTRLHHYFTKIDGHYHINKVIRDMCIFAVHNFIKDPPFARVDLVSCRNVLTYLDSFLQNKVLNSFHYSLKNEGILFLGKSENIRNGKYIFTTLSKPEKIFVRKPSDENYLPDPLEYANVDKSEEISDKKKSQELRIKELENELAEAHKTLKRISLELETATEQLQSNDAELLCVNDELMNRQEQLISMRNYSEYIVNVIREPLLIIDQDFFIKSANPAFYKYFETTQKETEGHSFFEIGDCQWDIPEFKELLLKTLVEKDIVEDFKIDTICTGLGKKIMIVNARRIMNTQSSGMILLAIEDVTDLITTHNLLTKKNLELEKYNDQLETISSAASNDLQEPLRKIQMFCNRIIDHEKNLTESGIHNLDRIQVISGNMSQLIADLITYSRINFIEKAYKKIDLNVLLKKVITDLKDRILEKEALITISSLPQVNVIPSQMQQLFINLIVNAIKYTKDDAIPQIKIEAEQPSKAEIVKIGGDPEINYTKINVMDNGIGFNSDFEDKIFDPFYRLHSNDQYSGSGLGLTIAKKIISNHHGFIIATSKINHGSTFSVYIPL
ncbi:Phytochrome-like protein cph1 [compost metagenome]